MDIVLVNSPIILYDDEQEKEKYASHGGDELSYYPLNILYLASSLEKDGHSVVIIDVSAEGLTLPQVIDKVKSYNPLIVGISSMTTGIQSAVRLAIHLQSAGFLVGIGGTHVSVDPTFITRYPMFDFGVVGEGEITLPEILRGYKKGVKPKGIYYGQTVENLDDLPFPARHLINTDIYKREELMDFEIPAAGILSSRGCPYQCIFCCIPNRQKVRFRSAKNIVDEMEEIYDKCGGNYSFVDDCFTYNGKRTIQFCEEIINRGLVVNYIASTRPDKINPEIGERLKRSGCTELYFGVESGSARIRNEVAKKWVKEEDIRQACDICRDNKIMSNLFLMLGFPSETKEDIKKTVQIGNRVRTDCVGVHITRPMPGSPLFTQAIEEGKVKETVIDDYALGKHGKGFRDNYPYYVPNGLTLEDLVEAKKKAYRSFYLSPQWMWRRIMVWLTIPGRFKDDLKLFKIAPYILWHGGSRGQLS